VKAEEVKSVENSSDEKFKVSGTVLAADTKIPVIGASVIIRGTTNGTLADLDGKFTLTGLKKDDVIQVSFVGFQTRSVIVKDESPLTILLDDAVQNLDEMVVVAMAPNEDGTTTIKAQMKDKNGEKSYLEGKMASTKKDGMTVNQVDWQKKASNSEPQEKVIFQVVEEMPQFPGGMGEAMKFLAKNMKYPVAAQQAKIEGRVIVQFVVGKDGSVSDVKVMRGVSPELDAEAIRVVGMMPKWIPGKQRGKAVAVKYTMPIMFRLQTPASEKEKNSSPIVMEVEEGASKESVDGMMNLVRPNSQKEDAPVIRINGTEDKLPLVVVDGEVKGNGTEHLSKVSVDQIESISVLKGATAEAEYGDKAKDGAIIITTKKNKK
jgi:TonB family protein